MTNNWINSIDKTWSLFLDRDGVINKRIIDGYVKKIDEFVFIDGVIETFRVFTEKFDKIFIVSNQQGVGKGVMTDAELDDVNGFMMKKIIMAGGRIDRIYCCTQLKSTLGNYRKPNPEMAYMAVRDFNVNLSKSIMIGDTDSDIEFGKNAGMYTVLVGDEAVKTKPDAVFDTLADFSMIL